MKKNIIFFLFFLASTSWVILAQEFVYKPINPAFGGEVFNYQWLLSSAEAQNFYEEVEEDVELTDLQEFNQNLNRQLLNRINQALLNSQVNIEDGLQPGVYNFGSLNVHVYQSTGGLVVEVLDINTGEQTQIIIPN
ncbi:MAG: curli assembly protein CsgF [Kordia sp.]|nr:MAG: curli assembly protein CsgF [Kordia sp.]